MWGKVDATFNDRFRVPRACAGRISSAWQCRSIPSNSTPTSASSRFRTKTSTTIATVDDSYYPSLALTWMQPDFWAEDFQLRFGYSETVARPDLREISDATYIDPFTEARIQATRS